LNGGTRDAVFWSLSAACRARSEKHGIALVVGEDLTAAKAIAAIGRQPEALLTAIGELGGVALVKVWIVFALAELRARIGRVALEVPNAFFLSLSGISVEEAVLFARIRIVPGNSRGVGCLVVVAGADAFRIHRIDEPVLIVIEAIAAGKDRIVAHGLVCRAPAVGWASLASRGAIGEWSTRFI